MLSARYGYDHFTDPNPFHNDILPNNVGTASQKSLAQAGGANLTSTLSDHVVNAFNFGWNKIYVNGSCVGLDVLDSVSPLDQFGYGRDYNLNPFTSFGCSSSGCQWPVP